MTQEHEAPKLSGYLFGRYASLIYLAGAAAAIWYRNVPLIAVFVFLLLLSALILLWRNRALARLVPELQISGERIFAGETFTVNASVDNAKWLPLVWMEWEFPRFEGIVWEEDRRERYVVRFLWLLWHQRVSWTVRGEARKRGVYDLGRFILRSGDGFRFSEAEQPHHLDRRLYVYPRLVPVKAPPFPHSLQWSAGGRRGGLHEDRLMLAGVREYEAGAEWRRINWKASARTGKLQINLYEPIVDRQLLFYLDVRGFVPPPEAPDQDPERQIEERKRRAEAFESFLSVIASLIVAYSRQGVRIGFMSNALSREGRPLDAVPPVSQPVPILDQLARMTARAGAAGTAALDRRMHGGRSSAPLFIFCAEIDEALYRWTMRHQHQIPGILLFYERESAYSGKGAGTACRLDALRLDGDGRRGRETEQ